MTLYLEYEASRLLDFSYEELIEKVIKKVIEYEKCPYEIELNIILTDNQIIHQLNKEYRQVDVPTDVLSFPMIDFNLPSYFDDLEKNSFSYFSPETGELLLGDIIISVDKVFEQADIYGHSLERELAFLIVHSMLHLFGYDHINEDERKVMEEKQEDILSLLDITRD